MASDNIQPLDSIKPMGPGTSGNEHHDDPAKKDYLEGRELFRKGEYAQAAIAFHNALRGFEEQGNESGVANAADRLGDACMARDEYAMAIANYKRAYAICEKEDDSFSLLALNKKMAASYRKLGDHEKALELLYDVLEHYRLSQNPKGAVEALGVIAEVYGEQGDKVKAADAYRSVASIHARFKHTRLANEYNQRVAELEQGQ